ncbi:MAG: Chaperone protein YcdY [Candidatus Erwinia impunctatus]|nr:Chaperone protein YcdY [Culicoides impunctatus]
MNEFSLICRILGSLFNRSPQDPLLTPLMTLLREKKLASQWPLEQDDLLDKLQQSSQSEDLQNDYQQLFIGAECSVPPFASHRQTQFSEDGLRTFLTERGMPVGELPVDHIGAILLAASWLEDQRQDDESEALEILFTTYLLPWCGPFLGKMEAHATTLFYRTLAILSREAIQALYDELQDAE